jgi:Zn-dependent protease with chaperone function
MPFCVNCGTKQIANKSICQKCWLDPSLNKKVIDYFLTENRINQTKNRKIKISYPGEKTSLYLSFFVLFILIIILNILSFGIFVIFLLYALFSLIWTGLKNKKVMLQASENNFKELFNLSKVICYRLGIPLSPIYIMRSQDYNAYTQGFFDKTWIVISSAIMDDFSPTEIGFILGHEYTHIRSRHTTWLTIMSPASSGTSSFISKVIGICFNLWSLKCEYTADRGGIIAIRDGEAGIKTLLKLCAGHKSTLALNWADIVKSNKDDNIIEKAIELMGTHPFPINRIKKIYLFCEQKNIYPCGKIHN